MNNLISLYPINEYMLHVNHFKLYYMRHTCINNSIPTPYKERGATLSNAMNLAKKMKLKICKQLLIKDRKKDRRRTKRDGSLYYKETNN